MAGFGSDPLPASTIAIGNVVVGDTVTASITISETGDAELSVNVGTLGGTNPERFAVTPASITIADGGSSQAIDISCKPTAVGPLSATLELTTNDPSNLTVPYKIECTGIPLSAVVNSTDDGVLATLANNLAKCTLREAIAAVNNTIDNKFGGCEITNGTIAFANSLVDQTITITGSALPVIKQPVTIQGLGQNNLTISGANTFRVFNINAGTAAVTIQDLTLTKGLANNANGGAILSSGIGPLTINNATISDSNATGTGITGRGGGINATNVKLIDSTVSGNFANIGGGIFATTVEVMSGSTLKGNVAGFQGGGINASTVEVNNSTLESNGANEKGGGIFAAKATVSDSTLNKNTATNSSGGGISANTVIAKNSTLSYNTAQFGGGVAAYSVEVSNSSTFSFNTATNSGGGIYATKTTVSDSELSSNQATVQGGGIYAYNTAMVNKSTLSGNTAQFGGGISANAVGVTDSTLSSNRAGTNGGGISAGDAEMLNSTLSLNTAVNNGGGIFGTNVTANNSTLNSNTAGNSGGGIRATTTVTVTNSTISSNTANTAGGGGINAATATVKNSTIVLNRANTANSGGILIGTPSQSVISNTIVAGNITGSTPSDISGTLNISSSSHNLIGSGGSGGLTNKDAGNLVDAAYDNVLSTVLGPLANNGGLTLTHALVSGSLAIDAGDPGFTAPPDVDQRGSTRVVNGRVDIGAYEAQ